MRRAGAWAVAVVGAVAVGGWPAGLAVLTVGAVDAWRGVRPRTVLACALGVLVTVPFVWVLSNRTRLGQPTFDLVVRAPWPGRLAAVAITLLVVGVVLDVQRSRPAAGDHDAVSSRSEGGRDA
jgi:hypothetical protein